MAEAGSLLTLLHCFGSGFFPLPGQVSEEHILFVTRKRPGPERPWLYSVHVPQTQELRESPVSLPEYRAGSKRQPFLQGQALCPGAGATSPHSVQRMFKDVPMFKDVLP